MKYYYYMRMSLCESRSRLSFLALLVVAAVVISAIGSNRSRNVIAPTPTAMGSKFGFRSESEGDKRLKKFFAEKDGNSLTYSEALVLLREGDAEFMAEFLDVLRTSVDHQARI